MNSPAYRDYLIAKGMPAESISVIPNGVDPDHFDPNARGEVLRREWAIDGKFVVTYAGALGLANDIPTILRAAKRLHRDHFPMREVSGPSRHSWTNRGERNTRNERHAPRLRGRGWLARQAQKVFRSRAAMPPIPARAPRQSPAR